MFSHAGLALSVAIGSCFNAGVLLIILLKRGWYASNVGWIGYIAKIAMGAIAMAAFLFWIQMGTDWAGMQAEWVMRLIKVLAIIVAAAIVYFATLFIFGWRARELRHAAKQN